MKVAKLSNMKRTAVGYSAVITRNSSEVSFKEVFLEMLGAAGLVAFIVVIGVLGLVYQ